MRFTKSEKTTAALEHAAKCPKLLQRERQLWQELLSPETHEITHQSLTELATHIRLCEHWGGKEKWVHELIDGAKPVIKTEAQELREQVASAELERRRTKLRAAIEERNYQRMVEDVSPTGAKNPIVLASELKQMRGHLYLAINLVIAMIACYVVGFYFGGRIFGTQQAKYICGGVGMVGALFVEALLLVIQLSRAEEKSEKLKRRAERLAKSRRPLPPPERGDIPVPLPPPVSRKDAAKSKKAD